MAAVSLGWLPRAHPAYRALTDMVLPFALTLLLMGIDVPSVARAGWRALLAMALGSASIIVGAPGIAWLLRAHLPAEAWTGIGCLAGTWTGGSMNLLALRTVLHTPEAMFTSLIIVDALIAYGWMALLVALAPRQAAWDRWVGADAVVPQLSDGAPAASPSKGSAVFGGALLAVGIVVGSRALAHLVPPPQALVSSHSGWVVLLVTTLALGASLIPALRHIGAQSERLGQMGLYIVLAAMGAQASLVGLWSAPVWLLVGLGVALVHGVVMVIGGRLLRLPLGLLATASQANFGGVVSAPLVGAIYEKRLVPIGLCLAIGANALGTYLGLGAALLARFLLNN
jgi:uncharacterized membrane protein